MGYAKLWREIIDSSLWEEPPSTRVLFVTCLAASDSQGFVRCTDESLERKSNLPHKPFLSALSALTSPDPRSRSKDSEGRRLEKVDGGYRIVNYSAYRDRLSDDPLAAAARERMRKYRNSNGDVVTLRNVREHRVTKRNPLSTSTSVSASEKVGAVGETFDLFWNAYPLKVAKKAALKAWLVAKDMPDVSMVIAAVERAKHSEQWRKDGGQFIPYPATWLNQGRWADDVGPAKVDPPRQQLYRDRQVSEYREQYQGLPEAERPRLLDHVRKQLGNEAVKEVLSGGGCA